MDPSDISLSRRKLIAAGTGTLGFFAFAGGAQAVLADSEVEYNHQAVIEAAGHDLQVDWVERYNGQTLEQQDTPTSRSSDADPLVTLTNAMPGDSGKLQFGLRILTDNGGSSAQAPPAGLQMRLRELPGSGAENGRTEPEEKAGDTTPSEGELGEHVDVRLWHDTGISVSDTPLYGHCNGQYDPVVDELIAEGSFDSVSVAPDSDEWIDLDANPDDPLDACLGPEEALCVALDWSIPETVGNIIQGDSLKFAIEFRPTEC